MQEDRRDDLVSMTAIVAGAVVSVAVTIGSVLLGGDEESVVEATDTGIRVEIMIDESPEPWTDPRGPERGPSDLEWEVVATYKVIEAMTETDPPSDVVDETLRALRRYAYSYPDNPFIHELFLKGIRVSQYYAYEGGDFDRASALAVSFGREAAESLRHDSSVLESIRMTVQLLDQECHELALRESRLVELAELIPDVEEVESLLEAGRASVGACFADDIG